MPLGIRIQGILLHLRDNPEAMAEHQAPEMRFMGKNQLWTMKMMFLGNPRHGLKESWQENEITDSPESCLLDTTWFNDECHVWFRLPLENSGEWNWQLIPINHHVATAPSEERDEIESGRERRKEMGWEVGGERWSQGGIDSREGGDFQCNAEPSGKWWSEQWLISHRPNSPKRIEETEPTLKRDNSQWPPRAYRPRRAAAAAWIGRVPGDAAPAAVITAFVAEKSSACYSSSPAFHFIKKRKYFQVVGKKIIMWILPSFLLVFPFCLRSIIGFSNSFLKIFRGGPMVFHRNSLRCFCRWAFLVSIELSGINSTGEQSDIKQSFFLDHWFFQVRFSWNISKDTWRFSEGKATIPAIPAPKNPQESLKNCN